MTPASDAAVAQAFREYDEGDIVQLRMIAQRARELDAAARTGVAPYVEQLCRECGQATMHMGDLCFSCTKKARAAIAAAYNKRQEGGNG